VCWVTFCDIFKQLRAHKYAAAVGEANITPDSLIGSSPLVAWQNEILIIWV
jgi:hypothetical protein